MKEMNYKIIQNLHVYVQYMHVYTDI